MVPAILLTDLAKRILCNKYVLIGIAVIILCAGAYFKGVSHERKKWEIRVDAEIAKAISEALKETQEAAKVQEKLEVQHDKRIQKILSKPMPDNDIAIMLSTWPDKDSETSSPGSP